MSGRPCKNPTCDRTGVTRTYCGRACQLAMRTRDNGHAIPDLWVGMATWHRLEAAADEAGLTVRDYVLDLIADDLYFAGAFD